MSRFYLMMVREPIAVLLFVLLIISVDGYGQSPAQWERQGDKAWKDNDYYGAAQAYKQAVIQDSSNLDRFMKYAHALRNYNNYDEAAAAYKEVYYLDHEHLHPTAQFYWGKMQQQTGAYAEALEALSNFLVSYPKRDAYLDRAKQLIKQCEWALMHLADSSNWTIHHINEGVNSYDSELAPKWNSDSSFYFTSLRFPDEDSLAWTTEKDPLLYTFLAEKADSFWTTTDTLTNQFKGYEPANVCFDSSFQTVFFSVCSLQCDLYRSGRNEKGWEPPVPLPDDINSVLGNETHPALVYQNGKTYLVYASNLQRGSIGHYDLWYTEVRGSNNYTRPRALRSINTDGDEITPFYERKSGRLFFSSNWHVGFGGFDVFAAYGSFTRPDSIKNLFRPVNSAANDLYFNLNSRNEGLLVSNRKGALAKKDATCCNDVFLLSPALKEDTAPTDTALLSEPLMRQKKVVESLEKGIQPNIEMRSVTVYFDNDHPNPGTRKTTTDLTYSETYQSYLNRQPLFLNAQLDSSAYTETQAFFTNRIEQGHHLLQATKDSLVALLDAGYNIRLGIRGFASPLAKSDYNMRLSARRIQSIINELESRKAIKAATEDGRLRFFALPAGELLAGKGVSDDLSQSESVFGLAATAERRATIYILDILKSGERSGVLVFDEEVINFGQVYAGVQNAVDVGFENVGNDTLFIESIQSNCGCTVGTLSSETLAPGERGALEVRFTGDEHRPGKQVRSIAIKVRNKPYPVLLFVKAEVK